MRFWLAVALFAAASENAQTPCSTYASHCASPSTHCSDTIESATPAACKTVAAPEPEPASTLLDNLVAAWKLEDTSDSASTHTLTNNGGTTFVAAKNNNGANFVAASSQNLSSTSNDFSGNQSFTVSCWIDPNQAGQTAGVSRDEASRDYSLLISNATAQFFYLNSGQAANVAQSMGAGFSLVVFYLDKGANTIGISVNDAVPTTAAVSGSYTTYSGQAFRIGGNSTSGFSTSVIDECYFWSRVLTADERTELYASGAGKFYPFP